MNAIDSSYEWGISPKNQGNLSQQQRSGLASLAPQSGLGLMGQPSMTPINPYANLPEPGFAPNATDYFSFANQEGQNMTGSGFMEGPNGPQFNIVASGGVNAGNKPYFDPNYPAESMLALKKWLAPQIASGADASQHARGLDYSGVGKYADQNAIRYLDQLAPTGQTGPDAMVQDFSRLYGPNIANGLVKNGAIPNGQPIAGGSTNSGAEFMSNYNPNGPKFGLYDLKSGANYATPGYFYNANQAPDTSKMPWLQNATQSGA